ncbi:class I SAM-dependent methyltransferase [Thiolapillus sp.]
MNILDEYILSKPSGQNILDIFDGEWSSKLPHQYGLHTRPGTASLFEDARITWLEEVFGPVSGLDILELGPLEGGHSYMLQERGANSVTAIEANTRAFLKCLCIKEVLGLNKVNFMLGDFAPYLEETDLSFDLVFASGVLYHMSNPVLLLKSISRVTSKLFLWTHYYDKNIIDTNGSLASKFSGIKSLDIDGKIYQFAEQHYNEALGWAGFCGGGKPTSIWMTKDSLIAALKDFGFTQLTFGFDGKDHPNGPAMAICASK